MFSLFRFGLKNMENVVLKDSFLTYLRARGRVVKASDS